MRPEQYSVKLKIQDRRLQLEEALKRLKKHDYKLLQPFFCLIFLSFAFPLISMGHQMKQLEPYANDQYINTSPKSKSISYT